MDSKEENSVAEVKPFSMRQYVLVCRHRNLHNCWPFAEKYLQMCLSLGLKDVLPPLEQPTTLPESLKGTSDLNCPKDDNDNAGFRKTAKPDLVEPEQQKIKSEFDIFSCEERLKLPDHEIPLSHGEDNHHDCNFPNILSHHIHRKSAAQATKHKWRRRRGRYCKKKSMAEILATAKHCTVEDLQRINKFCYIGSMMEESHQMEPLQNNSKSEITDEGLSREAESGGHEVGNVDMKERSTGAFKMKLNGY